MHEDVELLLRYAEEKSEAAFAELVARHLGFVYACALRRVGGDAHLAQDVAQQVFVALAQHAAGVARDAVLSGWLYTTTKNAAAQVVRGERRRQAREQKAQLMNELVSDSSPAADWAQLRPVLDDALDELSDDDRQAVLLRFFEGKSFTEVGAALRLAENSARMRVERALDKLQVLLARRGVTSTSAALGLALANQEAVALPMGLASAVTGAAVSAGATATSLFSGAFWPATVAAVAVVAGGGAWVAQSRTNAALQSELTTLQRAHGEAARLQVQNRELARTAAEVALWRGEDVELARLRAEALELQSLLAARKRAPQETAATTPRLVRVTGKVSRQGTIEIPPQGMMLADLLRGVELSEMAKATDIRVTRTLADGSIKTFHLDAAKDGRFQVEHKDVVYVPERIL